MIEVLEPTHPGGPFLFTLTRHGLMQVRGPGGAPPRVPQYVVAVREENTGLAFDWSVTPDNPGSARAEMEAEVVARMKDRSAWLERVASLVTQVEQWAREMGWSTRRVEKKLDDNRIGKHRVPALLMQEDADRVLLEPVGRSSPGSEGVVDLYLLPAYDDIASLYYYSDRWNIHYMLPGDKPVAEMSEAKPAPLTKESLQRVLAEMRQHAA